MKLFKSKEPLLDASPHADAGLFKDIFTNELDPRIRFFLQRISREDLNLLFDLRNSALRGTGFDIRSSGMKPGGYAIGSQKGHDEDGNTVYESAHVVTSMIDVFTMPRNEVDTKNDPLLCKQPTKHEKNDEEKGGLYALLSFNAGFRSILFFASIILFIGSFCKFVGSKNHKPEEAALYIFSGIASLLIWGSLESAITKKYIKSLQAEFNDAHYDALLNRLCEKENVRPMDWSSEINMNETCWTVRKLLLILLISFSDKMYSKIFSEILPKLIIGEKFSVTDDTHLFFNEPITVTIMKINASQMNPSSARRAAF